MILLNGFSTGLLLQVAIGPVFFLILTITLQRTVIDGLLSVLAVTLADYFYILLAAFGVGRLLERPKIKILMQITSCVALFVFGVIMIANSVRTMQETKTLITGHSDYFNSFLSALILTLSSPVTIVFWTSLFSTKAIDKGYGKRQLIPFGLGAGASTAVFLGLAVVLFSLIKSSVPTLAVRILNGIVGAVLVCYGIRSFLKAIRRSGAGAGAIQP